MGLGAPVRRTPLWLQLAFPRVATSHTPQGPSCEDPGRWTPGSPPEPPPKPRSGWPPRAVVFDLPGAVADGASPGSLSSEGVDVAQGGCPAAARPPCDLPDGHMARRQPPLPRPERTFVLASQQQPPSAPDPVEGRSPRQGMSPITGGLWQAFALVPFALVPDLASLAPFPAALPRPGSRGRKACFSCGPAGRR